MGVHRERLAASRAHKSFVKGARAALQSLGRTVPIPSDISPVMVGAKPLPFAAPPMMEEAFGYRGALRFVAFGYSPRTHGFAHCDGGDDIPAGDDLWRRFLRHPFVASQLPENRYPTLYGMLSRQAQPSPQEVTEGRNLQMGSVHRVHYLLLDRETRQVHICQRDQMILFFSLSEPDEKNIPRVFVDGLRMSSGNENYRLAPPPDIVVQLFACLDDRFKSLRPKVLS
jgi:hypothetical protein